MNIEHLNVILDALGARIDQLSTTLAMRDYQLRDANERLEKARKETQDVLGDLASKCEERARDQIIMTQAAKLVGKLLDRINRGEVAAAPYVRDALDNILAVLADCAKEEN